MTKITHHEVGDDTILTSTATVLVKVGITQWNTLVSFREADWNDGLKNQLSRRKVGIPIEVWEEMGKPETITITIEPGDQLNLEEHDEEDR